MLRRTALIVGGSRGIGRALADEFAGQGYDLLLVARSEFELQAQARRIMAHFGTRVEILALDAGDSDAPARIATALDAHAATLEYAVIGVGAWHVGALAGMPAAELQRIIGINVLVPLALQRAILAKLAPDGGLLFIGSLAGCMPLPWLATYAAAKANLHASVLALRQEMRGTAIKVCLLAPGAVATDFIPRADGQRWRWLVDVVASRPETVAHAAFRGLVSGVPVIVPGLLWRIAWLGMRILPGPLLQWIARHALSALRPQGPGATVIAAPSLGGH